MKKYKAYVLIKDLPNITAGHVFYKIELIDDEKYYVTNDDCSKKFIIHEDCLSDSDWFLEIDSSPYFDRLQIKNIIHKYDLTKVLKCEEDDYPHNHSGWVHETIEEVFESLLQKKKEKI